MPGGARTTVLNLMDGRLKDFNLPADRAVIAAFEECDQGNADQSHHLDPDDHPCFTEHRLGFACGDWIAYKPEREPKRS